MRIVSLLAFSCMLSLISCTPDKGAHSRGGVAKEKSVATNNIATMASTNPSTVTAETDAPQPRTTPCDENADRDDACWMLPRERAEFSEATFTNDGKPVVRFDRDSKDLAFYSEYPKSAEIDKKLVAFLRNDLAELYRENLKVGRDDRAKALKLGISPRVYQKIVIERIWTVTARSPGLIGLVEDDGNTDIHELMTETPFIWDRKRAKMIQFTDLFVDPRAALRLMQPDYCADLKHEVAERWKEGTDGTSDEGTSEYDPVDCPALSELLPPVPVDDGHGRIKGFTIIVGHFRVWAEGPYQAWARVTPPLMALIKPAYGTDFAIAAAVKRTKR